MRQADACIRLLNYGAVFRAACKTNAKEVPCFLPCIRLECWCRYASICGPPRTIAVALSRPTYCCPYVCMSVWLAGVVRNSGVDKECLIALAYKLSLAQVSVVSQYKPVYDWGLLKRRLPPRSGPRGSGRTSAIYALEVGGKSYTWTPCLIHKMRSSGHCLPNILPPIRDQCCDMRQRPRVTAA